MLMSSLKSQITGYAITVDNIGGAEGNIFCAAKYVRREVT